MNVLKRNMPHPVKDLPLRERQTNKGTQGSTRQINVPLNNVPSVSTTSYVSSCSNNMNSNIVILPRTNVLSKIPLWTRIALAVTALLIVTSAVAIPTVLSSLSG